MCQKSSLPGGFVEDLRGVSCVRERRVFKPSVNLLSVRGGCPAPVIMRGVDDPKKGTQASGTISIAGLLCPMCGNVRAPLAKVFFALWR